MVIKTFKLGNTTIEVDDEFYPKTEEENELVYEEFNRIGWEILKGGILCQKEVTEKEQYTLAKN